MKQNIRFITYILPLYIYSLYDFISYLKRLPVVETPYVHVLGLSDVFRKVYLYYLYFPYIHSLYDFESGLKRISEVENLYKHVLGLSHVF